jgi:hypothetical protein
VWREPATRQLLPLIRDPQFRTDERVRLTIVLDLLSAIDRWDGALPTESDLKPLFGCPDAMGVLLQARAALYHRLCDQGRAFAYCPQCKDGSVELDLLYYWHKLSLPAWDLFYANVLLLNPPRLSTELHPGRRPPRVPRIARLGYRYPTAAGPVAGEFGAMLEEAEQNSWRKYVPWDDFDAPAEHFAWKRTNPAFRALLRISAADRIHNGPATWESFPAGLYFFADLLLWVSYAADISAEKGLEVPCPRCGILFLPVF